MPHTLDDVYETRRENLTRLLREPGAKTQLAVRLGASQSHITHLLKPPSAASARAIREETARQIEQIMGLAMGQLDQPVKGADVVLTDPGGQVTLVEAKTKSISQIYSTNSEEDSAIRPELLEQAFRLVLDTLAKHKMQVPSEKAAKLARVVYEQALVTGKADPALVLTLINLMS
jgi:hypothetical protein